MSVMLALRCVAPGFALIGTATVWALAGPMAAGLTAVIFVLGVVTSELNRMRWSSVEDLEAVSTAELFELARGVAPAAVKAVPAASRVKFRARRQFPCTCQELAIGSGRSRRALVDRGRRHAAAAAVQACRKREAALRASLQRPPPPQTVSFRAAYAERAVG